MKTHLHSIDVPAFLSDRAFIPCQTRQECNWFFCLGQERRCSEGGKPRLLYLLVPHFLSRKWEQSSRLQKKGFPWRLGFGVMKGNEEQGSYTSVHVENKNLACTGSPSCTIEMHLPTMQGILHKSLRSPFSEIQHCINTSAHHQNTTNTEFAFHRDLAALILN